MLYKDINNHEIIDILLTGNVRLYFHTYLYSKMHVILLKGRGFKKKPRGKLKKPIERFKNKKEDTR